MFATYPLLAQVYKADMIFNLVFFISGSSVLLQGTLLPVVARWLHVTVPAKLKKKFPLDLELKDESRSLLLELDIPSDSAVIGKAVVELDLPTTAQIVMLHRGEKYLIVDGDTVFESGDHLLIMPDSEGTAQDIRNRFGEPPE